MTWTDDSEIWDNRVRRVGHAGYADSIIYNYDQPLRLRAIGTILGSLFRGGGRGRFALDIGCGTGDFVELMRREEFDVTGIDFGEEALSVARRRFSGVRNVKLVSHDLRDLDLQGQRYDIITSITVLQHIPNEQECNNVIRKLRNDQPSHGLFIILESAPLDVQGFSINGRLFKGDPTLAVPKKLRTKDQWVTIFEQCAYSLVGDYYHPQLGVQLAGYMAAVSHLFGLNQKAVKLVVLRLCRPFDLIPLVIPSRFRRTRILVFRKSAEG